MKYKNYVLKISTVLLLASTYACSEKEENKTTDKNKTTNSAVSEGSKDVQKVDEKKVVATNATDKKAEETKPATTAATTDNTKVAANTTTDKKVEEKKADEKAFVFDNKKEYKVQMETTMGKIKFKLFSKESPKAVENFVTLISRKYYDGIIFHRVIKGFMIQTGDPTGTGMAGVSAFGKEFENEDAPNLSYNKAGILGMANHGKNTNGSQFFITTEAKPHLDHGYTIFGEVTEGLDIVMAIEKVKTNEKDKPLEDVKMTKVTLID
ncbi:MAG: peptidylprolyl isomerase [Cyanobacteriota bacterium]